MGCIELGVKPPCVDVGERARRGRCSHTKWHVHGSALMWIPHERVDRFVSAAGQFGTGWSVLGSGPEHGRMTVNVEPAPSSLSTVIVPPWAMTIDRAMYRPRPRPP